MVHPRSQIQNHKKTLINGRKSTGNVLTILSVRFWRQSLFFITCSKVQIQELELVVNVRLCSCMNMLCTKVQYCLLCLAVHEICSFELCRCWPADLHVWYFMWRLSTLHAFGKKWRFQRFLTEFFTFLIIHHLFPDKGSDASSTSHSSTWLQCFSCQ